MALTSLLSTVAVTLSFSVGASVSVGGGGTAGITIGTANDPCGLKQRMRLERRYWERVYAVRPSDVPFLEALNVPMAETRRGGRTVRTTNLLDALAASGCDPELYDYIRLKSKRIN